MWEAKRKEDSNEPKISDLSHETRLVTFSKRRNSIYEADFWGWLRWWSSTGTFQGLAASGHSPLGANNELTVDFVR